MIGIGMKLISFEKKYFVNLSSLEVDKCLLGYLCTRHSLAIISSFHKSIRLMISFEEITGFINFLLPTRQMKSTS